MVREVTCYLLRVDYAMLPSNCHLLEIDQTLFITKIDIFTNHNLNPGLACSIVK